jgi:hypothetical protein
LQEEQMMGIHFEAITFFHYVSDMLAPVEWCFYIVMYAKAVARTQSTYLVQGVFSAINAIHP